MATGKLKFLQGKAHGQMRRSRWPRMIVAGFLVLILMAAVIYGASIRSTALAGSAFGARIGCSCHFVEGRGLKDCRKDFEPGMGMVMLSSDEGAQTVTARVPLIASQTAAFREGEGCVLEKWFD
ncbi:MAG: hypothetical protein RLY97_1302 [Pseudomonadota bacterium]|jgi:hypothetical protein